MNTININNIDSNYWEIDPTNSNEDTITLRRKPILPSTWREALDNKIEVTHKAISDITRFIPSTGLPTILESDDTPIWFKSESMAKAWYALFKLIHLRDIYNGNWKPNWNDERVIKYAIIRVRDGFTYTQPTTISVNLVFKSKEIRDLFYGNFKSIIEDAKMFI